MGLEAKATFSLILSTKTAEKKREWHFSRLEKIFINRKAFPLLIRILYHLSDHSEEGILSQIEVSSPYTLGRTTINPATRTIIYKGISKELAPYPFAILKYLFTCEDHCGCRTEMVGEIWKTDRICECSYNFNNSLSKLRKVLENMSDLCITNDPGGYLRLCVRE